MPITHVAPTGAIDLAEWTAAHSGNSLTWYNASDYGAVASTNSSTAIQAAIDAANAAGGGTAYIGPGSFLVDTTLNLKSNVRLLGSGAGTILQKADANSGTCAIEATGTLGTSVAISSGGTYGSTAVVTATNPATLVAGDFVLLRDSQFTNGSFGQNQELNRVRSVSGSGPFTFTLVNRLIGTYTSTPLIFKLTPVNSAQVEAMTVYVPGNAPTSIVQSGGCIGFDLAYDCTVRDVNLRGAYHLPGLRVLRSSHLEFSYVDIRDGQDITNGAGYGYGINIGESSHDCVVSHSYFENIRENDLTNNARNCIFANNVVRRTEIHAISTHGAGGGRLVIANNNIHGSGQNGITLGANVIAATDTDILVTGNYIEDYTNYAITCGAVTSGQTVAVNIVGNYFGACAGTGDGYMVGVGPLASQVSIRGNTFDNTNGGALTGALLVNNNAAAANVVDTVVENNDFRNITGRGVVIGKATRTIVRNNHFTAVSNSSVDSATLGPAVDTWIYGNSSSSSANNIGAVDRVWGNAWGTAAAGMAQNPRVFSLASAHAISSTTATEVTGLGPCTLEVGTYAFRFLILAQSATATVSPMFGVNFTGTAAVKHFRLRYPSTATSTATGTADDAGATSGQYEESVAQTAYSTAAPNLGATGGVATTATNILYIIEGLLVVTVAGDLELWHGSETATSTTVSAGTSLIVERTV